jgi:hypothetical protein
MTRIDDPAFSTVLGIDWDNHASVEPRTQNLRLDKALAIYS